MFYSMSKEVYPNLLKMPLLLLKQDTRKGEIKARKIIIDSLKDHLLPYISKLKTSKEMYDKIVAMFEI